jgi:hypothetical protein
MHTYVHADRQLANTWCIYMSVTRNEESNARKSMHVDGFCACVQDTFAWWRIVLMHALRQLSALYEHTSKCVHCTSTHQSVCTVRAHIKVSALYEHTSKCVHCTSTHQSVCTVRAHIKVSAHQSTLRTSSVCIIPIIAYISILSICIHTYYIYNTLHRSADDHIWKHALERHVSYSNNNKYFEHNFMYMYRHDFVYMILYACMHLDTCIWFHAYLSALFRVHNFVYMILCAWFRIHDFVCMYVPGYMYMISCISICMISCRCEFICLVRVFKYKNQ